MPILKNGQWVDENHPLYKAEQAGGAAPGVTGDPPPPTVTGDPQPPPTAPKEFTPQEAAAAGLGWVPSNHPLYGTPGFVGAGTSTPAPTVPGPAGGTTYQPPNLAPGTPGQTPLDTQLSNAQTYAQNPGAPPSNATTNAGTQDAVRNSYLQTIQKGTSVDTTDPNFRQQADAFSAAQERSRRNAQDDRGEAAFASGMRGSGAATVDERLINENAARNTGQFEAQLVGRELESRRDEIRNALSSLGGMISGDQQLALQREMAALDAALKRESLAQTGSLGGQDLQLRDKLGTGALNIDLIRALLQNQQFSDQFGLDYANSQFSNYSSLIPR